MIAKLIGVFICLLLNVGLQNLNDKDREAHHFTYLHPVYRIWELSILDPDSPEIGSPQHNVLWTKEQNRVRGMDNGGAPNWITVSSECNHLHVHLLHHLPSEKSTKEERRARKSEEAEWERHEEEHRLSINGYVD